jgi:hypothetical protein
MTTQGRDSLRLFTSQDNNICLNSSSSAKGASSNMIIRLKTIAVASVSAGGGGAVEKNDKPQRKNTVINVKTSSNAFTE